MGLMDRDLGNRVVGVEVWLVGQGGAAQTAAAGCTQRAMQDDQRLGGTAEVLDNRGVGVTAVERGVQLGLESARQRLGGHEPPPFENEAAALYHELAPKASAIAILVPGHSNIHGQLRDLPRQSL